MRNIRALIGLPVIVDSRRVGRVIRTELSKDMMELTGLWIASGFFQTRFISIDTIEVIGKVSIIADNAGIRMHCRKDDLFCRAVGTDGSRVGVITGAEFDELSFRIEALELSCGLWDDLFTGRRRIQHFALNQENGNVIVDISEIEKEVVRQ